MKDWDREALRSLTYIHTDKGHTRQWLYQIGRAPDPFYSYGAIQSVAHFMECKVTDGRGRAWEEMWKAGIGVRRWQLP